MASDPEIAGLRTRKILDNVMLRRTKTTTAVNRCRLDTFSNR
jgi:hypothetical protein